MITLYDFKGAPSPRRAKMLLTEKGLKFETIQVDIMTGEQLGAAYRKINPRCTVPALDLGEGHILTENAEITAYLEAAHPAPPMLGTTALEKAAVAKWNWRMEMDGLLAVAEILRNTSKGMKDRALTGPRNVTQIPELAERGRQRIAWFFEDLDAQLQGHDYVAGDHYSVADITGTIAVDFARWVKAFPLESHTALMDWHARMKERPSYTA